MKKFLFIALLVVVIDQVSKFYIKTNFHIGESLMVFDDWFYLVFVENPGMAYGMQWGGLAGKIGLAIFRWILIVGIIYYVVTNTRAQKSNSWFILPMSLILAGAIGNVIDSTFYGLIFDTGTTWNEFTQDWNRYYPGISQADFTGYAPIFQGCVVDMLHFPLFDYNIPQSVPVIGGYSGTFFSPVFNIADSAISIGGAIILLFREKAFPSTPEEPKTTSQLG
ncbi:MAG: lipoprotein signal peptidase [Weeksellaceae bacterium]|nr:lipoprotein signal peptidase [Weeksellaceae bacterium]